MADPVYYAWGPIRSGMPDGEVKVVPAGSKVTPKDINASDADFAELISSGAVRTMKYPELPEGYQDSPINFLRDEVRRMMGENPDDAGSFEELLVAGMLTSGDYTDRTEEGVLLPGVEEGSSTKK